MGHTFSTLVAIYLFAEFFLLLGVVRMLWWYRDNPIIRAFGLMASAMLLNMACQLISNSDRPHGIAYPPYFLWWWVIGKTIETTGVLTVFLFLSKNRRS